MSQPYRYTLRTTKPNEIQIIIKGRFRKIYNTTSIIRDTQYQGLESDGDFVYRARVLAETLITNMNTDDERLRDLRDRIRKNMVRRWIRP